MKIGLRHIILLLCTLCLGCISCTENTEPTSNHIDDGQLRIVYCIAGAAATRAETEPESEPGWGDEDGNGTDEWHENIIKRIDLFVFNRNDGKLFKHIASSALDVDAEKEQAFTQDELTYNDVVSGNYIYYMVANHDFENAGIVENSFTLNDLKREVTIDVEFNNVQTSFAMDGKIETVPEPVGNTVTLLFELKRAAAKIRISVEDAKQTSLIKDCKFQLFNYVEKGTSVLSDDEPYGEINRRESMAALTGYDGLLSFENEQVVFYSYPNDWFDADKVTEYKDDDGNTNGNWVIEDYASEIPIIKDNRTYILLEAPFENKAYYYEVPVNYSIYENNDAVWFTIEQIGEIHDLYRIKRNYIYDITVTIDRAGGTVSEPVKLTNLEYEVKDWKGEINIEVPSFD